MVLHRPICWLLCFVQFTAFSFQQRGTLRLAVQTALLADFEIDPLCFAIAVPLLIYPIPFSLFALPSSLWLVDVSIEWGEVVGGSDGFIWLYVVLAAVGSWHLFVGPWLISWCMVSRWSAKRKGNGTRECPYR